MDKTRRPSNWLIGKDAEGYRAEFLGLVEKAKTLAK